MPSLFRDYETRSAVELKKSGAHLYFLSPTTDVWCCAYAVDDEPVQLWTPGMPVPDEFIEAALHEDEWKVHAFNDAFERLCEACIMAPRYGFPKFPMHMHRCTMVMAYEMGLPGDLERAVAAVGIDQQKDMKGHRLMMQMAKPRRVDPDGTLVWWDDEERRQRLYAYCAQDVEAERALEKKLLPLSPSELALWHLDQRINDRGVLIDIAACHGAQALVKMATAKLDAAMRDATNGSVTACSQIQALMQWVQSRGLDAKSLGKENLTDFLLMDDLPADVRRALEIRQEGSKTSTSKINAMLNCVSGDRRARGMFQFYGANTGRWAGRRVQLHNTPRGTMPFAQVEEVLNLLGGE